MLKKILFMLFALCLTSQGLKAQSCPTAVAGPNQTICQGDTIALYGNVVPGASPVWSTPAPAPITLPFPGSPAITPTNPVKFVPIGNRTDTTTNDTVRVTIGAPATIAGLGGGGATPTANSYKMYYTITSAGCPASKDSLTILVNPLPTASIVSNNQSSCSGASTFTVTARKPASGTTGVWSIVSQPGTGAVVIQPSPNDSIGLVTGLSNGITKLKWQTTNTTTGCTASATTTITIGTTLPTKAVVPVTSMTACVGTTVQLIGSIATSGTPQWTNANPPTALGTGSLGAGLGGILNGGGLTTPTPAKSITFSPTNGDNDTVNVTLDTTGIFKLYYTISMGTANANSSCTSRDSMTITSSNCAATTGIAKNSAEYFSISIQPNPASESFNLSIKDYKTSITEVSIITLEGYEVKKELLGTVQDLLKTISISDLSKGIYFVKVKKGDEVQVTKLLVQ